MTKTFLVTIKEFGPSWTVVAFPNGDTLNVARGFSLPVLTKRLGEQVALVHETNDKYSHFALEPLVN